MATAYELWDFESGNIVAVYESEAEALASVRQTLRDHGHTNVETLVLGTNEDDCDGVQIAAGDELIARAEALVPQRG